MSTTTSFSRVLAGATVEAPDEVRSRGFEAAGDLAGSQLSADVPEDWMQGRSVFGGLQLALALRAMRALVPADPLRTLQATFFAPVRQGTVRVRAEVMRRGKSTMHVEARILDGGATLALAIGVFGVARVSQVAVTPTQPKLDLGRS